MTDDNSTHGFDRRTVLKTTAGLAGAAALPFGAGSAAAASEFPTVDDALDTTSSTAQEVLVVFDSNAAVDRLRHLDLDVGYHKFEVLPIGYTKLTGSQIETVADWPEVQYVEANAELDYHNDDAREVTRAAQVQDEYFYTGESVHAVVIDSGVDGDHPDLQANLRHNFQYTDPLNEDTLWVEADGADTDTVGHGTHVSGSIAGDGSASDGEYKGMAPDADLTVYAAGASLLVVQAVAAYDDMVAKQRSGELDVQVVNNSYGSVSGADFNPNGALETATWYAFTEGIVPVYSAANSGPDTNTLNNYAKAPYVLSVAATDDEMYVTDFSSRGRTPSYTQGEGAQYDRELALNNVRELRDASYDDQPVVAEESYSGTVGPGSSDAGVGESAYEQWTAPSDAGFVHIEVSWTPAGEDIDVFLHEGSRDGPVVASGATLDNPEIMESTIEPGTTYYVEIRPYLNVTATYTVDLTAREQLDSAPTGPYGLYRNGVGAPGELIMSTLSPDDPLQGYAGADSDTEVWYGLLSGTSMSGPVTAGVTTLVLDAYYQNNGEWPDPIDTILLLEATADDARPGHNPWTMGTGFVDAVAAVERAAAGDLATFDEVELAVDGEVTDQRFAIDATRSDDGSAFTGGQTNQVDVTVESATEAAVVRDEIPFEWTVVGGDAHTVYTEDGAKYVEFDASVGAGDTVTYFAEAPSGTGSTGTYTFGPAEAAPADGDGSFQDCTGTDTNEVVSQST
ncbi:S8 family serine peptidase [Haloarchaeobius sp. TZWWS8]|uniref:S8 family serine peptidase n=1 Tax=Haloarchaeobius sp. TZWWS8 TaxID=3446121 RepID=UPI003EBE8C21